MIPITRRYIELGLVNEASDELEVIDWDDRMNSEVLAVRVDLYHTLQSVCFGLSLAFANVVEDIDETDFSSSSGISTEPVRRIIRHDQCCYPGQ